MAVEIENFDFDPEFLKKKYREERDKRLRQDGNEQYQEVTGEFSYFVEDPYVQEAITREPIQEEIEVVIIGGGFGGMLAGARLREAGIDNFKIIEKGGDFGGTYISPCLKKQVSYRNRNTLMLLKLWNIAK